mmetsp:Transcript_25771/g.54397  ORF Transcript_25771/g.54397 Transcript_25771/m.54397 type:complete len:91 (+) Transcript_25771:40-312(+)
MLAGIFAFFRFFRSWRGRGCLALAASTCLSVVLQRGLRGRPPAPPLIAALPIASVGAYFLIPGKDSESERPSEGDGGNDIARRAGDCRTP